MLPLNYLAIPIFGFPKNRWEARLILLAESCWALLSDASDVVIHF